MRLVKFVTLLSAAAVSMSVAFTAFAAPEMAKTQVLKYNLGAEPATLDPHLSTGIPESVCEYNIYEGLVRLDEKNNPVPAAAESWTVSDDGLTYTFKIRKGAKWSDGAAVTANDFEYAWKRLLDPATASEYAYQGYYLKNGEEFNAGKIKDSSKVGVDAKDAQTLVATLGAPCPYFLSLLAHTSLLPVKKASVDANPTGWAVKGTSIVGNGPFKITKWEHNSKITMVPNEKYWDAKAVKLDTLEVYLIDNQNTELTMFETGELDLGDNPPASEMARLKKEGKVKIGAYIGTYYYMFNTKRAPYNDVKVRLALNAAIEREKITEFIMKGGQIPAEAYVPGGIADAKKGTDFREVGGSYYKDGNIALGRKLLADAGFKDGKGFPETEILYNTSANHKKIAEAIQEFWKKNLSIKVSLKNEEWQVYLDTRNALKYDVARAGWIGDYPDPMTFLDMWTTGNGNNDTGWSNKAYDKLIDECKSAISTTLRVKKMHEAEAILMAEMPIIPIYFYTRPYTQKPWVQDVLKSSLGYVDFTSSWISKH